MEYLLDEYDPDHKLSPPHHDKKARAQYLKWLVWAEASLTIPVVGYVVNIVLLPEEKRNQKLAKS